ncbi:protein Vhl [Adelges cooleyi]|uniref:protein Vhl n=1 Tax=Adelges cooleyi TaxID=133065 RepID=UPI00217F3E31|nr:protein Vhl [Adelges cooleyi]
MMALMDDQLRYNRQPAYIRFKNDTHYDVEVVWINFHKKEKPYCILPPGQFLDVNTYATHPWIFRECISKSRMVANGQEVFMAIPWVEEHRRLAFDHPISIPLRTMVIIKMPGAMELRLLCLLKLVNIIKAKEDIRTLELPVILTKELIQMIVNKEEYKSRLTN